MSVPRLVEIRQHFPDRSLSVRNEMEAAGWAAKVPAGIRIAVGVGNRGISDFDTIVRGVVDSWRHRGCWFSVYSGQECHFFSAILCRLG